MIPVVFPSDATEFHTQGFGPLRCISCEVEEERNGIYELTARVLADSPRFDKLVEGNIIVATHSNKRDRQPFQIYSVSKTIDGLAEVKAEHISYRLNKIVTMPFEATGVQAALNGLKNNATENCPFTFWTDKESTVTYKPKVPKTIKASLAGEGGSIIDTFSAGDYEFDVFAVKFWADRGADNGVTVRYGKNLTELEKETDISDIYTAIVPYWTGQDAEGNEMTVMLSSTPANNVVQSEYVDYFPTARTVAVDFADKFQDPPTAEQLRAAAVSYLNENARRQLFTTLTASFIELSQTDQHKDYYKLESVNLCDTVTVVHPILQISDKLRVTRVVYDVLADRNKEITLGDLKRTLANMVKGGGGTRGATGAAGKSAYQSAVNTGYTGTEAQWVASLTGPQGPKGDTGPQGPKGDKGDPGTSGANDKAAYVLQNFTPASFMNNYNPTLYRVGGVFFLEALVGIRSSTVPASTSTYISIGAGTYPEEMDAYIQNTADTLNVGFACFTDDSYKWMVRPAVIEFSSNRRANIMVLLHDVSALVANNVMYIHIVFSFT